MEKALLLSPAYGWFAGLLVIMIVVTALFGLILFIALRPIKKDEFDESSAAKKLKRRETEITIELLKNKNDKQKTDELLSTLREVKSAEKLVDELMEDEKTEEPAAKKAPVKKAPRPAPAAPAEKRAAPAKPAEKAEQPQKVEEGSQADQGRARPRGAEGETRQACRGGEGRRGRGCRSRRQKRGRQKTIKIYTDPSFRARIFLWKRAAVFANIM